MTHNTFTYSQLTSTHSRTDFDRAVVLFGGLRQSDPFRISNMDTFSNVLFVLVGDSESYTYDKITFSLPSALIALDYYASLCLLNPSLFS